MSPISLFALCLRQFKAVLIIMGILLTTPSPAQLKNDSCFSEDFRDFSPAASPRKGWKLNNISAKIINGALRIREVGKNQHGSIYRYVPYKKGYPYLQIELGQIEDSRFSAYAANNSAFGKAFGKLFQGINTFSLEAQMFKSSVGKFCLSILQLGKQGNTPGGWLDILSVKVVKYPVGGLVFELEQKSKKDNIARIGDCITIKYFAPQYASVTEIPVALFEARSFSPVHFSKDVLIIKDDGKNGDAKSGDKIYSREIKIDLNATSLNIPFNRACGGKIIASAEVNSNFTYGFTWFGFDVKGKHKIDRRLRASSPVVRDYRKLWIEYTKGKNLALGKKVIMSHRANYRRFKKGYTDSVDLTDGKISSRCDDRIWYDSGAVGWFQGAATGINFLIDLGKKLPLNSVVIRCLGGQATKNIRLPKSLKVSVSNDGKNFYKTSSLVKLMPAEAKQSDFKNYYYLPENGIAYAYPFKMAVDAEARYVNVKVTGATGWFFTDEIAVIKAGSQETKNSNFNRVYEEQQPQKLFFSGLAVSPRTGRLTVSDNVLTPNFFEIQDMREGDSRKKAFKLVLELPPELEIVGSEAKSSDCLIEDKKAIRWEISRRSSKKFPIYIRSIGKLTSSKAVLYAECANEPVNKVEVPVELISIPEVPDLKRLHISLTWMRIGSAGKYPDFFDAWKHFGFNAVACFPRYWNGKIPAASQEFLEEARRRGFKIIMNGSPFWGLYKLRLPAGAEIYSKFKDGRKSKDLCPCYTGKYYQQEMDRIARCAELAKPNYVFWDIECWHKGAQDAAKCIACQKKMKNYKVKSLGEFLAMCGTKHMKDLRDAVKKGVGKSPMPILATYDNEPQQPLYQHGVYDFNRIYPQYIEMAQPSLYVSGRAKDVKESVRANHKLLKNKKIIPWLTPGCYGEYPSYKLEQMILEALINGSTGITYYQFQDFDTPLDFYYHAKALAEIAPYENLIVDGEVLEPAGSNKGLSYSGVKKDGEMLLLVGNYKKVATQTAFTAPFSKVFEIKDLRSGKKLAPRKKIELSVPKGQIRLLYIKGK